MEKVLSVKNLTKKFKRVVVNNISFDVERGNVYGLLGPNGSGKSTTFGMLLSTINPTSGDWFWFGKKGTDPETLKRIGAIIEQPNFYPYLSAETNLKIVAEIKGTPSARIDEVLNMVKLLERKKDKFKTFSLGMKQRLAIASALLNNPEVLILDEPTNGLDPEGIIQIREIIGSIAQQGITIIIASHLLDEIEKAHPDVFNILLQILDEGHVTDSLGRKIDFRNTIIILTSNIGTRDIKDFGDGVGFGTNAKKTNSDSRARGTIENARKKAFAPEFLNRIDDIIIFNSLEKEDIKKIIDIELNKLYSRLEKLNYKVELTDNAKDFISEKGWDKDFGARPLKRAIQKYIEDLLAEMLVNKQLTEGETVVLDLNEAKDGLEGKTSKPKKSAEISQS